MANERETFWDVVKGLAIIAVVLIHTTSSNSAAGIVWRQFINWPVAIFFFVAGYFCHPRHSYLAFVAGKARRILVPLLTATAVYGAIGVWQEWRQGTGIGVSCVFSAFLSFPLGWGYFALALFQCYLVAPALRRFAIRRAFKLSLAAYSASALYAYLAATVLNDVLTTAHMVPYVLGITWLPFFSLGLFLQDRRMTWVDNRFLSLGGLIACLCLAVVTGLFWLQAGTIQLARSQIRLSCVLFSLILACSLPNLADRLRLQNPVAVRLLIRLGQISLVTYLWHRLVLILLRSFASAVLLSVPWLPLLVILTFVAIAVVVPTSWRRRLWWAGF